MNHPDFLNLSADHPAPSAALVGPPDKRDLALGAVFAHLADAEAAIMSHISSVSSFPSDGDIDQYPDVLPTLTAVLRSIGHASGIVEAINQWLGEQINE